MSAGLSAPKKGLMLPSEKMLLALHVWSIPTTGATMCNILTEASKEGQLYEKPIFVAKIAEVALKFFFWVFPKQGIAYSSLFHPTVLKFLLSFYHFKRPARIGQNVGYKSINRSK
jgi:hypothetical protein